MRTIDILIITIGIATSVAIICNYAIKKTESESFHKNIEAYRCLNKVPPIGKYIRPSYKKKKKK